MFQRISNSLGAVRSRVLIGFVLVATIASSASGEGPVHGDVEAYRTATNLQLALWDSVPDGYIHVAIDCPGSLSWPIKAEYDCWWRDHDLVRWEGSYAIEGEQKVRRFVACLTKDEFLFARCDADGHIASMEVFEKIELRNRPWMYATPHSCWFAAMPGQRSAAENLKNVVLEADETATAQRNGAIVRVSFTKNGALAATRQYSLLQAGAAILRETYGNPEWEATWTSAGENRVRPETISWVRLAADPSDGFSFLLRFEKCDLSAKRPAADFTLDGVGMPRGTPIYDQKPGGRRGPLFFGTPAPPPPDAAIKAASEAAKGRGLGDDDR